jgi:hypothetical protein
VSCNVDVKNSELDSSLTEKQQTIITINMSAGTTLQLPHLEEYPIHVSLFKDVKNAAYLRQQLLEANAEFEYAFLDATTVIFSLWLCSNIIRHI